MSAESIPDYLTKQLFIEKNVVTYRSLSRAHKIHVNAAKNELANYIKTGHDHKVFATFLISGVPIERETYSMDVDNEDGEEPNLEYSGGDYDVPKTKMLLVREDELQDAKSQFSRINTISVYSLSPSPIRDSGYIVPPTVEVVYPKDRTEGAGFAETVGRIIGSHVERQSGKKAPPPGLGPPRTKPVAPLTVKEKADMSKARLEKFEKQKTEAAANAEKETKSKPTGKLDFSKAKVKVKDESKSAAAKASSSASTTAKVKAEPKAAAASSSSKSREDTTTKAASKGTNSKSANALLSDSEGEKVVQPERSKGKGKAAAALPSESESDRSRSKATPPRPGRRPTKKAVESESEDDEDGPLVRRRKSKALSKLADKLEQEAEKEIHEMMDVDDDQVVRNRKAARAPPVYSKEEEEEEEEVEIPQTKEEEDVDMEDDVPVQKKKARKPKKVVPVGRNGLRKRRKMVSTQRMEGGFFVMEDHSEYESVDEEEPETEPPKAKSKTSKKADNPKTTAKASTSTKQADDPPPKTHDPKPKTTAKATTSTKQADDPPPKTTAKGSTNKPAEKNQKNIASFFTKPKGK